MFLTCLRTLVRHLSVRAPRARRPRRPARVSFRPRLEGLEGRLAPATITWSNPAGGLWNAGGNWSGGAVPGPADDAVIGALNAGAAVTHASGADAVHSLALSSALKVTSGSALTAAAGFTLNLSGSLTADTGGVFTADGAAGSTRSNGGSLFATHRGAIHLPAFTSYLVVPGASTISATWQATGAGRLLDLPGVASITVPAIAPPHSATLNIAATAGGHVNLSGTTTATAGAGSPGIGTIKVSADGSGSRVDLTALTSFQGNVREHLVSPLTASNRGTVDLGAGTPTLAYVKVNLASMGTIHVGTLHIATGCSLSGIGTINGNVQNDALVSAGIASGSTQTGVLRVNGNYTQDRQRYPGDPSGWYGRRSV
jgi:hypothetical protein